MTAKAVSASGIDSRVTPSRARSFGQAIVRSPGHEHEQVVALAAAHDDRLDDVRRVDAAGARRLVEAADGTVPDDLVLQAEGGDGRQRRLLTLGRGPARAACLTSMPPWFTQAPV